LLKIAIITNNYKPYSGGLVSSIDSFYEQLIRLGCEVIIITLDFLGNCVIEKDIHRIKCPVRFVYKKNHIAIPWRPEESIATLIKKFSPDIIHSQHPFLLGMAALSVSKKLNIPIVFTYHTQYDKYLHYIPLPNSLVEAPIRNRTLYYCKNMNGIIVPSFSIYKLLTEVELNKKIEIIPSGILPIFLPQNFASKKIAGPFKLLTVSRFRKEKNVQFLIDSYSKLDSDKFVFTLIGYGDELPNLKNYAYNVLGLSQDKIKFLEAPSKEVIASFYKSADAFIFSSFTETQGLVLAEAMAAGTPVIAVDAPGSCDIVIDNNNGFLVDSVEQMVQKIQLLASDKALHENMQKFAWETGQNYSSKKTTQKLLNFYFSVLNN